MAERLERIRSDGVLPPDEPLPKFSLKETTMSLSQWDWANTLVDRYVDHVEDTGLKSVQRFAAERSGDNSANMLRVLSGYVLEATGMDGEYRRIHEVYPVSLTEQGVEVFLERYRSYVDNNNESTRQKRAAVVEAGDVSVESPSRATLIGEYVLQNGLLLYDPGQARMLHPDVLIPPDESEVDPPESG